MSIIVVTMQGERIPAQVCSKKASRLVNDEAWYFQYAMSVSPGSIGWEKNPVTGSEHGKMLRFERTDTGTTVNISRDNVAYIEELKHG